MKRNAKHKEQRVGKSLRPVAEISFANILKRSYKTLYQVVFKHKILIFESLLGIMQNQSTS